MKYFFLIVIFFRFNFALAQHMTSPNGCISARFSLKDSLGNGVSAGEPYLDILYSGYKKAIPMLKGLKLGLDREDEHFSKNLKLTGAIDKSNISERYETRHGKRKQRSNEANEWIYHFENDHHKRMDLVVRLYNDGVAFRYVFPDRDTLKHAVIDEQTTFVIPSGSRSWMQPFTGSYEDFYYSDKDSLPNKSQEEWGFPSLFSIAKDSVWMLISEADLSRFNAASRLHAGKQAGSFKVSDPYDVKASLSEQLFVSGNWSSPWRVMIIGHLEEIVASTLIEDVSTPNQLSDTDFVKPGAVSWNYWAYNHGTKDYQRVVEYVDLAVKMKWPYTLFDWEWDQMGNGGNLADAVKYARSKGIKPLMWYNSGKSGPTPVARLNTHESRMKEFEWLNHLGIYGIKVDFFDDDKQHTIAYYLDILQDAATFKLMVDFHGATVPRGWSRTYPNLMTTEAVYGAEWYNNGPTMTTKAAWHNTVLPFTRNVVGGMDYTPVTFTNSQHPHITTYAHELALAVAFESGLQHFADRPSGYLQLPLPAMKFLQEVPVAWDDTKLVNGYPGERIVLARRSGSKWYVSGLNGTDASQTLELTFKYLSPGKYTLTLISDGATDQAFKIENIAVTQAGKIKVKCLPRGGFTGYLQKVK
ncbi:glycoside hydrolase family 97 protein [Chitinophaga filiformis]|uniref:Glycoside hydrolase family 97 protein n=1 Tax=Chitinophaga filiformis TaxID=104663 RepID=A0ABY4HV57_CHIFI|nr:glycoside hydrolase family 97 protein [Chitinophaga filiformis]UPK67348.1 glycoside hydrolase family 97 protein [Chitinophaga filiformis]